MAQKNKYKERLYKCTACDTEQMVGTNHIGRIWSACKNCKHNGGMVCMEPEAIAARSKVELITTKLHYYWFDVSKPKDKKEYLQLKKKLEEMGLVMFASISTGHSSLMRKIKSLNGWNVHLETTYIFQNQWNCSEGLRLMDWAQPIFPNKDVKTGYWLEQTPEMDELRTSQKKCNYCGTIMASDDGQCKKNPECIDYGMGELITPERKKVIGSE